MKKVRGVARAATYGQARAEEVAKAVRTILEEVAAGNDILNGACAVFVFPCHYENGSAILSGKRPDNAYQILVFHLTEHPQGPVNFLDFRTSEDESVTGNLILTGYIEFTGKYTLEHSMHHHQNISGYYDFRMFVDDAVKAIAELEKGHVVP